MVVIRLRFPGGRYHATPWDSHVNEGRVEWPPSPWRLLRGLVSVGFTTQSWSEVPETAKSLLKKLAEKSPSYWLPVVTPGHSRHYMPLGKFKNKVEETTLVWDTWLNISKEEAVSVFWDVELTEEEKTLLQSLVGSLNYLGRSESWVIGEVHFDGFVGKEPNAFPATAAPGPSHDWEPVMLMAPLTTWEGDTVLFQRPARGHGKRRDGGRAQQEGRLSWLECMLQDTDQWKSAGWSSAPGTTKVKYLRHKNCIQNVTATIKRDVSGRRVECALLCLTTPSGVRSALPPVQRTLAQTELLHDALVSHVCRMEGAACPELTGRDEDGLPLRNSHTHAHILALDLDHDRHIDHFLIFAPMGLGYAAQTAIRRMRRTWTKGGAGDLQLALACSGNLESLRQIGPPLKRGILEVLGPAGGSLAWVSKTPYVPPRFLKKTGKNSLAGMINSELTGRGFPKAKRVEILPVSEEPAPFRHFLRIRSRGGTPPPVDIYYCLRIELEAAARGPLVLGYGSHYGLGLFSACDDGIRAGRE
ncbi:MAG: type I-G CRISPR-associated protein Csb2 [Bryobacteraceae bacterium]